MLSNAPSPGSTSPAVAALILAAGKSTRMKSKTPKALHSLLGKPLLRFALDAVRDAGANRTVIVVGHQADQLKSALGDEYEYALQSEQLGTGHAVQMAEPLLSDWQGTLLILPGDAPLLSVDLLNSLLAHHRDTNAAATLLTAILDDAASYGRIVRDANGQVLSIVEAKDATNEQLSLREIGTSVYAFDASLLFAALKLVTPHNAQGEYYLTDAISLLAGQGHRVEAFVSTDADIVRGVNNRSELVELSQILRHRIHQAHMAAGVTIVDPLTTFIDADVKIGQDTTIHPFTVLSGVTDIGEDCEIGPGARISDSKLGNGVSVRDSYIIASDIDNGSRIGPYSHLRPGNVVGKNVKIGAFVELKNAQLGDKVSAGHLAYLGDTEIGSNTNVGAGVITCNYDGMDKHRTVIGSDVFVGSHTTLVAPVMLEDGSFTAAGSTITENVPSDALGIGRARQVNKEGWAAKRRRK